VASTTSNRSVPSASLYRFFAPGGVLSRTHPAYEFRRGQLQMAEAVEHLLVVVHEEDGPLHAAPRVPAEAGVAPSWTTCAGAHCDHGVAQSITPWSPGAGGLGLPVTSTTSPIWLKL